MDLEEHARLLGRIIGNLQSLELLLRAYLYAMGDPPHTPLHAGKSFDSLAVGDTVGVNALTDFSSLGELIERYNTRIQTTHPHLVVDDSIVDLRDALAHGRVSAPDPTNDLSLLKFSKPSGGTTRVTFLQKLTDQWSKTQASRVFAEMKEVSQAPGAPIVSGQ